MESVIAKRGNIEMILFFVFGSRAMEIFAKKMYQTYLIEIVVGVDYFLVVHRRR